MSKKAIPLACLLLFLCGCATPRKEKPVETVKEMSLSLWCDDLPAMRSFYVQQLGLKESWFHDASDFGLLCCKGSAFGLMVWRSPTPLPKAKDWAAQSSPDGKGSQTPSFSFAFADEVAYRAMLGRLKQAGVTTSAPVPAWADNSFWQLYARDPMGNTVELFWAPSGKPASTIWKD